MPVLRGAARRVRHVGAHLWDELLDLLYPEPPPCSLCRGRGDPAATIPVCRACRERIAVIDRLHCRQCGRAARSDRCEQCRRAPTAFDLCRAYGVYEGYLRQLVHDLKYGGDASIARGLGAFMAWVVMSERRYGRIDAVVAVPLHPRRLAERGYNQAELLAVRVAHALGKPLATPLVRVRETSPQSRLPFSERAANVRRAFAVARPESVAGRRWLLVDDVLTTGATLSAAATALKRAGAKRCTAVCAAAGSLDADFDTT